MINSGKIDYYVESEQGRVYALKPDLKIGVAYNAENREWIRPERSIELYNSVSSSAECQKVPLELVKKTHAKMPSPCSTLNEIEKSHKALMKRKVPTH